MLGFLELAVSARGNMESMTRRHKLFGIQLSTSVIKPLEAFIKESDITCTRLVQGYERAALTVAQHIAEMEKQRQVCLKDWDELTEALAAEKLKPQGVLKKKQQTTRAFTRFEELKTQAMPARAQFVQVTRPILLRKFQAQEIARMEILQAAMAEFSKAQAAFWGTEIPPPDSATLSASAVLNDTMARWLRQHGSAPAFQPVPSQLPCSAEALETEAWRDFIVIPQPGEEEEEEEDVTPARPAAGLASMLRGVVSKKKKRFQEGGFDLDLTYITPRIIAMGFPAESISGLYRNNMVDVQKFFNTRHPNRVHLYNLCAEIHYDPQKFDGRVSCFPFFDHNPCPLNLILPFCIHVHEWLNKDPANVVAVHCKAGKGRTGFMIACYLLYAKMCGSAAEALEFYANKRTRDAKGVTIPSQIRYVSYFEDLLRSIGWLDRINPPIPLRHVLFLKSVTIRGIPYAYSSCPEQLSFIIVDPNKKHEDGTYKTVFSSKGVLVPHSDLAQDCVLFTAENAPCIAELSDDFKVMFSGSSKLFSLWANTRVVHEEVPLSFHPPFKPPSRIQLDPFKVGPKDQRSAKVIVCPFCNHERPQQDGPEEEEDSGLCASCKRNFSEGESLASPRVEGIEEKDAVVEERMKAEKSKDWREVAGRLQRESEQAAKVQTAYRLVMGKQDLDKAIKDKKHLVFPAYMTVEFLFHSVHRIEMTKDNSSPQAISQLTGPVIHSGQPAPPVMRSHSASVLSPRSSGGLQRSSNSLVSLVRIASGPAATSPASSTSSNSPSSSSSSLSPPSPSRRSSSAPIDQETA